MSDDLYRPSDPTVLVAFATHRGSTAAVAERVAEVIGAIGLEVDVKSADDVCDPRPYGAVVVGGAVRRGSWHHDARCLLGRRREALSRIPVAVFGTQPLDLEPTTLEESRRVLARALRATPEIEPVALAVFATGAADPGHSVPFDGWRANGAWAGTAVDAWARDLATRLAFPGVRTAALGGHVA